MEENDGNNMPNDLLDIPKLSPQNKRSRVTQLPRKCGICRIFDPIAAFFPHFLLFPWAFLTEFFS
jgi:hypothetical protein